MITYVVRLFALAILAAPAAAWGQERGAYVGGAIGQAGYRGTCHGAPAGTTCDNNDTASRIFGGYQFTPRFAIELGYHDLGTAVAHGGGPAGVTERADITAFDFTFVGMLPVGNRFSLLARLGFYRGEMQAAPPPAGMAARGWETKYTNDITYAFGGRYAFTEDAEFRLEYQHFGHLGTGSTPALDIHLFSLGAVYRF
jgi:OOP family OmpA-OmpF porin